MATPFTCALAALDTSVDWAFAERIRISPMIATANGRPALDPSRPLVEPMAVVGAAPTLLRPVETRGTGREDRFGIGFAAEKHVVSVQRSQLDGVEPKVRDRVTLLDRPGLPVFEIAREPGQSDAVRITFPLAAIGGGA